MRRLFNAFVDALAFVVMVVFGVLAGFLIAWLNRWRR